MQFKIKNTVYEISFTFFALILFLLTLNKNTSFLLVFFFALLHEAVHLIFIYLFSVAPKKVSFTLFGANILRALKSNGSCASEIAINLSAPLFNLIIGLLINLISNLFTEYRAILLNISEINIALGVLNLLPFYNFDGGNALKLLLFNYLEEKTTESIVKGISVVITIVFSFISVYIFFNYEHNISLVLISVYMIFAIIFKK